MKVEVFKGGYDRNFSYLIYAGNEGLVIDPFEPVEQYFNRADKLGVKIVGVLNTHKHFDHVSGNKRMANRGVNVIEGEIALNQEKIQVIETPGHTLESVCYFVDDKLFTGDTLFVGKIGGTSTEEQAKTEFESLKKLMELSDETIIYPGHDYGVKPTSTISEEKKSNPFILKEDFKDFLWLKQNWSQYKKEHGIK